MTAAYQQLPGGAILRLADNVSFLPAPGNADYSRYLEDEAAGAEVAPADQLPAPEPTRDERLLEAVDQAKTAVAGGAFTQQQAATLAAVFDGLGQAITGGSS
jgi:hypothetical protein